MNGMENGRGKMIMWLLGVIFTLLLGFATYWTGRIQGMEMVDREMQNEYKKHVIQNEQRMTRLEARYEQIQETLARIERAVELAHHERVLQEKGR